MNRNNGRRSFPEGLLLLIGLVNLVHRRHDFVLLEADAFVLPNDCSSPSFRFAKSSFLESDNCRNQQNFRKQQTNLFSTSASAAYLDSISYKPPSVEDGLLGATSKYLDALSSVSNQLQTSAGNYQYYSQTYNPNNNNDASAPTASGATVGQVQASVEAASTAANHAGASFSEDQLVNEVVQRVTQEFSSTLEAFAGKKADSFLDSASTVLADSTQAYIWDIEEAAEKGRKGGAAMKAAAQQKLNSNAPNEETLRELTSKLDNTFRSFKENLSSSTHSATASVAGALRKETSQPNAAIEAAKRQESILGFKQKVETGALTPEALSTNAKEAVDLASNVATKAMTELESTASTAELGKTASVTTSVFSKSLSETASNVDAAIGGVTSKASSAIGSIFTNTNQGIEQALSSVAKTTNAATTSIDAATSSAMGSIGAVGSSISSGASAAASSVSNSFGAVGTSFTGGASSAATSVQTSVGSLGSTAKAAVISAQPGTAATGGKISAVALSASQGFGMPGNAYAGGGDVAGLIEMTVATIVSIPRAILDAAMFETNPNGMNELMDGVSASLANDILVPLSEPIRSGATTAPPLDQAQAVLQSLEMVLALVVGIPRAALEGLTGLTVGEIQTELAHADIYALAEQLAGFASAVSSVLVSLLQVIAQAISIIVSQTGLGDAIASGQEELVSQLSRFVVEDLLPAILDGLLFILQQFAMLLLEGGSAVLATM